MQSQSCYECSLPVRSSMGLMAQRRLPSLEPILWHNRQQGNSHRNGKYSRDNRAAKLERASRRAGSVPWALRVLLTPYWRNVAPRETRVAVLKWPHVLVVLLHVIEVSSTSPAWRSLRLLLLGRAALNSRHQGWSKKLIVVNIF